MAEIFRQSSKTLSRDTVFIICLMARSVTPSPSPSPRHSAVHRPSHLLLQNVSPRTVENNAVHRLAPNRGMLHSRQASNNSNQQSSLDDSGVVDDHDGDDVTSVEEHDKRDNRESRHDWQEKVPSNNTDADAIVEPDARARVRAGADAEAETPSERERPQPTRSGYLRASTNVPASLGTTTAREIRVFKCNGVKTKKQMYTLPPEYLSHIVILGKAENTHKVYTDKSPGSRVTRKLLVARGNV